MKIISILKVLSEKYPFRIDEVEMVFDYCKSYDDTIKIMEQSISGGLALQSVVEVWVELDRRINIMNLEWFNENYIENKKLIEFLLEDAEKHHLITKEQIYNGCKEIKKVVTKKGLLDTHITLLVNMTDVGINAEIAGIKLREALFNTMECK